MVGGMLCKSDKSPIIIVIVIVIIIIIKQWTLIIYNGH